MTIVLKKPVPARASHAEFYASEVQICTGGSSDASGCVQPPLGDYYTKPVHLDARNFVQNTWDALSVALYYPKDSIENANLQAFFQFSSAFIAIAKQLPSNGYVLDFSWDGNTIHRHADLNNNGTITSLDEFAKASYQPGVPFDSLDWSERYDANGSITSLDVKGRIGALDQAGYLFGAIVQAGLEGFADNYNTSFDPNGQFAGHLDVTTDSPTGFVAHGVEFENGANTPGLPDVVNIDITGP
jgi:hypothetical protein